MDVYILIAAVVILLIAVLLFIKKPQPVEGVSPD